MKFLLASVLTLFLSAPVFAGDCGCNGCQCPNGVCPDCPKTCCPTGTCREPVYGVRFVWKSVDGMKNTQICYRNDQPYMVWYADSDTVRYYRPILNGWTGLSVSPWNNGRIPSPIGERK